MEETTQAPQAETPAEQPAAKATPEQPAATEEKPKEEGKKEEGKKDDAKKSKVPSEEKFLAAISYVPPAFILPLITKPNSKYCQFHGKQGLGMFAVDFLVLFILAAVPMIGSILFLGAIGISAAAILQAYQGNEWKIPVLGDLMAKVDISKFVAPAAPAKKGEKKEEKKEEEKPAEEAPAEEKPAEEAPAEAPTEEPKEKAPAPETPAEPAAPEAPAEEAPKEETPPQQ